MSIFPPPLNPGDTIGVMATSCWLEEADIIAAKDFVESKGYKVFVHPQATARLNQSAGSAKEKVDAFHDLIRHPAIKAIMGARGGNRALTMLDKIDYTLVKQNPKIIMGYSDVTVLLNAIYMHTGMITYHGPLFRELPRRPEFEQVFSLLAGAKAPIPLPGCNVLKGGVAQGRLIGGNLSLFQTLLGTPHLPDLNGALLFLEDIGDHVSRYDRMLGHLRNVGVFEKISGLVIGAFTNMDDDAERPFGFTLEDVIREHTDDFNGLVIMNAPFGHGQHLPAFPVGAPVKVTASPGEGGDAAVVEIL